MNRIEYDSSAASARQIHGHPRGLLSKNHRIDTESKTRTTTRHIPIYPHSIGITQARRNDLRCFKILTGYQTDTPHTNLSSIVCENRLKAGADRHLKLKPSNARTLPEIQTEDKEIVICFKVPVSILIKRFNPVQHFCIRQLTRDSHRHNTLTHVNDFQRK